MHERLIAEELVQQAVARAKEGGIGQITRVRVSLSKADHALGEALRFWFNVVKSGTPAEGAVLEIEAGENDAVMLVSLEGKEMPCSPAEL